LTTSGGIKKAQVQRRCWTPALGFSKSHSIVNAYNLGLMSALAYKDETEQKALLAKFLKPDSSARSDHKSAPLPARKEMSLSGSLADTSEFFLQNAPWKNTLADYEFHDESASASGLALTGSYLAGRTRDTQLFIVSNSDVVIAAVRGTTGLEDLMQDLKVYPTLMDSGTDLGRVHSGFWQQYLIARKKLQEYVGRTEHKEKPILLTGHSLGGAVATLLAAHFGATRKVMLYTFGSPMAGHPSFIRYCESVPKFPHFRYANVADLVPTLPSPALGYAHYGQLMEIEDAYGSYFLKPIDGDHAGFRFTLGSIDFGSGGPKVHLLEDIAGPHSMEFYISAIKEELKYAMIGHDGDEPGMLGQRLRQKRSYTLNKQKHVEQPQLNLSALSGIRRYRMELKRAQRDIEHQEVTPPSKPQWQNHLLANIDIPQAELEREMKYHRALH